jgi:purine-binding chemotaxis protein CheW
VSIAKSDDNRESELISQPQSWQWISFRIADTRYCHPIRDIEEIFHYTEPTPVPGAAPGILGILNIRGSIATIYSGRALFNLSPAEASEHWRIITLSLDDNLIGVNVDSVEEIIHFDPEQVEHNHEVSNKESLVKGTIYVKEKLYSVLDFNRLIEDL